MTAHATNSPILVLGMGNPLLTDDGIGLRVVDCAQREIFLPDSLTVFKKNYCGGIDLLYDIAGYDRAIIVDSVVTGKAAPGYCHEFSVDSIAGWAQQRLVYAHGVNISTVFRIGRRCGYDMPKKAVIFGIESIDTTTFSEKVTPALEASLEQIIDKIKRKLSAWTQKTGPSSVAHPRRGRIRHKNTSRFKPERCKERS
jgi:hydrogenase maturation protease